MLTVYGLKVSYFTGKLEAYLRYKEIPYEFHALTGKEFTEALPTGFALSGSSRLELALAHSAQIDLPDLTVSSLLA